MPLCNVVLNSDYAAREIIKMSCVRYKDPMESLSIPKPLKALNNLCIVPFWLLGIIAHPIAAPQWLISVGSRIFLRGLHRMLVLSTSHHQNLTNL